MEEHSVITIVRDDGTIIINDVPFAPDTSVKIIITLIGPNSHHFDPYSLQGTPVRYERPIDPVAEEDWKVNQ